jgi:pyruvate dehydrogenase E1 component alpha subunit
MSDHTTADDASRYRSKEEVEKWKQKDPILRLRLFMEKKKLWSQKYEDEVTKKAKEIIDEAIKIEEGIEHLQPEDMFRYTYENLTPRQKRQMRERLKGSEF